MVTLIKYYDKDVLKNITAALTLRPDRVIFLYDQEMCDLSHFLGLGTCFRRHIPNIVLEQFPVNILDMEDISQKTRAAIQEGENAAIDLTGGSELMMIAGYQVGKEADIPLYYADLVKGQLLNLQEKHRAIPTTQLSLEDFIEARGASLAGNSHREPDPKRYQDILDMCQILFEQLDQWKRTSSFLQVVTAKISSQELSLEHKMETFLKNGRKVVPNRKLLYAFQKFGFIKHLKMTKEHLKFSFTSLESKQYMINYGVWLELYVFITAKQTGVFHDVKLGMMIDWNAYDESTIAGNEIDVVFTDHSLPVFVSCKLRHADASAINELVVEKKRLGGWFSKGVLVAFGNDKQNQSGTYQRAQELGIELLDAKDILSGDFGERLVKSVREHDIVCMKWKQV